MDAVSSALLAANRRLYELRERHGVGQRPAADGSLLTADHRPPATDRQLPAADHRPPTTLSPTRHSQTCHLPSTNPQTQIPDPYLKLHPDIALAMLRHGHAADGRLWLLMRYLDREGRGWLRIDLVRNKLTAKDSKLRVCGPRQLRNLLRNGQGLFWDRDEGRVWLRSAARVARALGVGRLSGVPVALPVQVLLGGIGHVRAHFYASFHSGRQGQRNRSTSEGVQKPISRARLKAITHVPPRTQRVYEKAADVTVQKNIAVGERHTVADAQERAWCHGRGTFTFIDHEGRQGPAGRRYVAWCLPNSYQGPHDPSPKGRQKKINRQIDLVNKGAQGNGLPASDFRRRSSALFHPNGLAAGRAYNRDAGRDAYWPQKLKRPSRLQAWHVIPARR